MKTGYFTTTDGAPVMLLTGGNSCAGYTVLSSCTFFENEKGIEYTVSKRLLSDLQEKGLLFYETKKSL